MSVDSTQFKNVMKLWASGVTVVTAYSEQHGPRGMTATAFSSVSMEPPQILVCLNQATDTGALVLEQGWFGVNILTVDQQEVSNQFAGGLSQEQRFEAVSWQLGEQNTPLLNHALACMECRVVEHIKAGTHWVIIGELEQTLCRSGEPLLYAQGGYRQLL
jgi:flavin reductase (DIM6/NTAB) family NADH-FMN oxidoreductase RutF